MAWWKENRLRMVQNNLRDIDAKMDIPAYVNTLTALGANACMVGCGGISAFYPTQLDFVHVNPYMEGDFFGRLLEQCHRAGIRVIARFDFSKTHESVFEKYPAWYTRSMHGDVIRYHDTVATCVNGGYQQDCAIKILQEVLGKYPVDGVFFNMFGYQTRDYTGNYFGICQCESCKARFFEETGMRLPKAEDISDPAFPRYRTFKQDTVDRLLEKISGAVHAISAEVAVCTYSHKGVDIVRNESNSAVDRPLPLWLYNSEFNVSVVNDSFTDKISSNCVINAVDIPYRFMGVSKYLNQARLYGNMAAGGGLDWCIIGAFEGYPDRENFDSVREVFQLHKRHERVYGQFERQAKILVVTEQVFGMHGGGSHEVLGIYKMLKESHLLFDVVDWRELDAFAPRLEKYEWVILPATSVLREGAFLRALRAGQQKVLATGLALSGDESLVDELFGVTLGESLSPVRGAYVSVADKQRFPSFPERDWVYLDKEYRFMRLSQGAQGFLPLVTPARYGPPERCFGHELSAQPSAAWKDRFCYLPWQAGALYYEQGYEAFKHIVCDIIGRGLSPFETTAPSQVEVFFDKIGERSYLFQMLNLSGFNGTTFFAPIDIPDIKTSFPNQRVEKVERLTLDGREAVAYDGAFIWPRLSQYEAFVVTVKE